LISEFARAAPAIAMIRAGRPPGKIPARGRQTSSRKPRSPNAPSRPTGPRAPKRAGRA
jgi:hypothetical protein